MFLILPVYNLPIQISRKCLILTKLISLVLSTGFIGNGRSCSHSDHCVSTIDVLVEDHCKRELFKKYEACKRVYIPKEEYFLIMDQLKKISVDDKKKTHHQYYLMSKFEILQCGNVENVIKKRLTEKDTPLYYVSTDDTFDITKWAHISTGHSGRDRMLKELSKKYEKLSNCSSHYAWTVNGNARGRQLKEWWSNLF